LLDVRHKYNLEFNISRKPTATDTKIRDSSSHPAEYKMLATEYLLHRMNMCPIANRAEIEQQIIKQILNNNQYYPHI
jgi:hypothetical protein